MAANAATAADPAADHGPRHRPALQIEVDHLTVRAAPRDRARGLSVKRLILDLLEAIANDRLVNAVFD
jgi:hypothetical protein